jgi:long-chain fatty acid transport protein
MRSAIKATTAAAMVVLGAASAAHAGGFEYPDNGSVAFGRGGAFTARASDPTALMHNVAGMVGVPDVQVTLSSNFAFLGHCFARAGSYDTVPGAAIDTEGTRFENSHYHERDTPYPEVCNQAGVFPAPQLLATWRIHERVSVGVGVYGPNSVGRQSFPDQVMTPNGLAPSPIRYMLLRSDLLIIHPTIAVAAAPVRWLRLGAALQPSIAHFEFATMANAVSSQAQSPNTDLLTDASATGFFFAANFGLQIVAPRYFSFGAHVHFNPETVALSGEAKTTAGYYLANDSPDRVQSTFQIDRMEVGLPLQARLGVRFALPRDQNAPTQDSPEYDPMRDDLFDIELDATYEHSSAFRALTLNNSGSIGTAEGMTVPAPAMLSVPHNWRDVFGVRLGGDFNAIRNVLAVRAGISFEQGAMQPGRFPAGPMAGQPSLAFTHVDLPAYDTFGLHVGASYRWRWLTVSAAYGHFFMSALDASREGALPIIGTSGALTEAQCMGSAGAGACQSNRGVFRASLDTLNIGLTGRF